MLNGNGNGGNGSVQIVPMVVQPTWVEEAETLVPQHSLDAVPILHMQPIQLFNGMRIFVHAPQYHWHMEGAGDALSID